MTGRAPREIAVATMTLARDAAEESLLRRSLNTLTGHGWPVFVCDGGSGETFVDFLRSLPATIVVSPVHAGLVGQVRASLCAAARASDGCVLYTESDKLEFFDAHLRAFISSASSLDAGCVLASRSTAAFSSFPTTQRSVEATINGLCSDFLGVEGDYSYGPFLVRADLVPHVAGVSPDLGWGWRHFLFAIAHRLGDPPVHLVGNFACPDEQRAEDGRDRLHRLRQLGQNVNGLLAGLTCDLARAVPTVRSSTI